MNTSNSAIKGLEGLRSAWNRFQAALPVSSHPEREYAVRAALMLFALGLGILFAHSETSGLSRRAEGYQSEQLMREAKMLASETGERLELIQSQVVAFRICER